MLDFATTTQEYAKSVTTAHQVVATRNRWSREFNEMKDDDRSKEPRMKLFRPSPVERRRRALESALDAAQAEGITVDEWFRVQRTDPALYERSDWAGLTDELSSKTGRGRTAA